LTSILSDLAKIPAEDKVLILSFFKGALDLLEAMLHDLKIGYCRYDGEISHEARQVELDRFKSTPSCRVLLMTVQTGGKGLNICEANHVIFVDRWCVNLCWVNLCNQLLPLQASRGVYTNRKTSFP
jgi:SNF2 family DNA or RNA helicase